MSSPADSSEEEEYEEEEGGGELWGELERFSAQVEALLA